MYELLVENAQEHTFGIIKVFRLFLLRNKINFNILMNLQMLIA